MYMLGYEHFDDLHSRGKIVKLLHSYRFSPKCENLHHSENMNWIKKWTWLAILNYSNHSTTTMRNHFMYFL